MNLAGKSVVIFGCGYVGTMVARRAVHGGARVTALTRNAEKAAALRAADLAVVLADLTTDEWHRSIPAADHVVNCVSSGDGGLDGYRRSYVDGMRSIARWLQGSGGGSGTFCYTGSTSVYPQDDGRLVTEECATGGGERAEILLEAERIAREAAGRWAGRCFVLRLAGIYGPGRHSLLDALRSGAEAVPAGNHHLNLIQRDDAAAAIIACLAAPTEVAGGILNVADGRPMRREELVRWLAGRLGRAVPRLVDGGETRRADRRPADRVISPAKIERVLGWKAAFADARAGYEAILAG